jgi:hypothetical protein
MGTVIPKLIWYLYRYLWPFNIDVLRDEGSPNCCEQEAGQRGRRGWKERKRIQISSLVYCSYECFRYVDDQNIVSRLYQQTIHVSSA